MISVGIDVSKGKSTVCILKPYGEIVASPFEVMHTESELKNLIQMIQRLDGEIRIVMEATGIYHLPMLSALQDQNFFVAVINPFEMKEYASRGLRRVKTDKLDSITIANYGIDNWYRLENHQGSDDVYSELKLLGRQYCHVRSLVPERNDNLSADTDAVWQGIVYRRHCGIFRIGNGTVFTE